MSTAAIELTKGLVDEAPRRREIFVMKPSDVTGMFGQGLRLVDVRYDHETDEVYFVLEGGRCYGEWRRGCAVSRVRGKPLPTAYVMRKNYENYE